MSAYTVFVAALSVMLHRPEDGGRGALGEWDDGPPNVWRHRIAVTVAILLWLLTWLGGWWLGRTLSSGSFVLTLVGALVGWCAGLVVATLVLYADERF